MKTRTLTFLFFSLIIFFISSPSLYHHWIIHLLFYSFVESFFLSTPSLIVVLLYIIIWIIPKPCTVSFGRATYKFLGQPEVIAFNERYPNEEFIQKIVKKGMEYELKVLYDLLDKGMLEYAEANEGEGK